MTNKDIPAAASLDYRAVMRAIPRDEKRRLMTLTNTHGLVRLSIHIGIIAGMAWVNATAAGFLGIMAALGQGIAMCFLFCAMHEASHGTAFKTKFFNTALTSAAGMLLFLGPIWFTLFHTAHHRHTHDQDHDPELATPKPQTWGQYLTHITGIMIWVSSIKTLIINAVKTPQSAFIPATAQTRVMGEARVMLLLYTALFGGGLLYAPLLLWQFWILPLLLGQPFLRLFLMAEHAGCPHDPDMLKNSRTTRTNPLVLLLSWNMPYHTAHHSFPAVPFHQLPNFHRYLDQHVAATANGYHEFHYDYARHLQETS